MPHPSRWPLALLAAILILAGSSFAAQPVEAVLPRDAARRLSLNGPWKFRYAAGPAATDETFAAAGFSDQAWATITVPGHWELQGFAEPKYGKELAEGTGFYRRTFRVPDAWAGQRIMLRLDGVLFGYDAWINGKPVGSWASGYNPATFDITEAVRAREENVLAVRVTTRSHGWEFDTNDCWSLSGIYRDVTLFAVPAAHLRGFSVRTALAPDGSATLHVATTASAATTLGGSLQGPDGKPAGNLVFEADQAGNAVAHLRLASPQLWTAETPALYQLDLVLGSGEQVTAKVGLREVSVVDGVLRLNGRPIKLRGVDHHDLWPDTGRAASEGQLRRDLALIQAANCNFIRTSHYPPHPRLLELCDELGLYVMDEVPFGFGEEHLADENYRADLLARAEATVRRDAHHASVIIWSVGNENPNTPLTFAAARRTKELDPTRPVCFPQIGSYFAGSFGELPPEIDVYAPHYPATATDRDYAARLTRPVIFTEYAHALGLAFDQLQAQWAIMQASPRLAGGAVWMFQDQGILRTANPGETPASSPALGLAVWPDASHYHDTAGNLGMDGIVYADRHLQPDFWQVRKVYAPVQIASGPLAIPPGGNTVTITVENRFDFRSLEGCTLAWQLVVDGRRLPGGEAALHAPAHGTERVSLAAELPAGPAPRFAWIELRCLDEKLAPIYERHLRLLPASAAPLLDGVLAKAAAGLTLAEDAAAFTVTHPQFSVVLDRTSGTITVADHSGALLATGFIPHTGRRFTEGERMRAAKERTWSGAALRAANLKTTAVHTANGLLLRVSGEFARLGTPGQGVTGSTELVIRDDGAIDVAYDYEITGGGGLLLEAGLTLHAPAAAAEFRWIGAGPHAGYPGKHALNEFGRYQVSRGDLEFSGNRRNVAVAGLFAAQGQGVLIVPAEAADIAIEADADGTWLSHNALVSGRGTKFSAPDDAQEAVRGRHFAGKFTIVPLAARWPESLARWFGAPKAVPAINPYLHSYDR